MLKLLCMKQKNIDKKHKLVCMPEDLNEDIYHTRVLDIKLNYKKIYKKPNVFTRAFKYIAQKCIALPLLYLYDKIYLGVKVKGKKNLRGLKGGAITISNHVHYVDWSVCPVFLSKQKSVVVVTLKDNFKIPTVRHLCKLYGCLPLAETPSDWVLFYKCIKRSLDEGKIVHLFPEASLWPYYNKLRPFKRGSFYFAVKYNVPIIPYLITFRKPKGIEKLVRRAPRLNIIVGEPLYANASLDSKQQIEDLSQRAEQAMQKMLDENPSYEYYRYVSEEEFNRIREERKK